jgi:hypothetical protein
MGACPAGGRSLPVAWTTGHRMGSWGCTGTVSLSEGCGGVSWLRGCQVVAGDIKHLMEAEAAGKQLLSTAWPSAWAHGRCQPKRTSRRWSWLTRSVTGGKNGGR